MKTFNQFLEETEPKEPQKTKPRKARKKINRGWSQNRSNRQLFPYNTPQTNKNNNQSSSRLP